MLYLLMFRYDYNVCLDITYHLHRSFLIIDITLIQQMPKNFIHIALYGIVNLHLLNSSLERNLPHHRIHCNGLITIVTSTGNLHYDQM